MGELGATEPDQRAAGTAALAQTLNQNTLHTARHALYYHPDTDPFAGFEMPQPRTRELAVPHDQINNWIEEAALEQGRPSWLQAPGE